MPPTTKFLPAKVPPVPVANTTAFTFPSEIEVKVKSQKDLMHVAKIPLPVVSHHYANEWLIVLRFKASFDPCSSSQN